MNRFSPARSFAAAALALGVFGIASTAHAGTDLYFSLGVPAPVYVDPAPVYVQPQPVYTPPVYSEPAQVYVRPAPAWRGAYDNDAWRRAEWRREHWRREHWRHEHGWDRHGWHDDDDD